ncbi:MAG: class B sortase [Clostridia bacterium]
MENKTNNLETNNKISANSATGIPAQDVQKRKRGRPKKVDEGIARPSTKKRGRPRKNPEQPPKPVGRPNKGDKAQGIEISKKKKEEKPVKRKYLTAKQMEEKLRRERKIREKQEKKRLKDKNISLYYNLESEYEFEDANAKRMPKVRRKIKFRKVLLLVLLIIFFASSSIVVSWYVRTSNAAKKYENIATQVLLIGKKDANAESNFDTVNFQELKSINADAVAWIKIEGTTINYPVLQTTNNEYYLNNDIYKKADQCGSIYMDYQNDKRLVDKNTVIYGHHIKRGIMFADLEKICAGELGNDVDIYIYTPEKSMKFKVFSAYKNIPEEYSINTEITEKEYGQFVETLKNKSEKEFVGNPDKSNQIITLSTCDKSGKERILVHAELDDIE